MDHEMTALYDMESRDPDGGQRQPTDADYMAFERWATDTYGPDLWQRYSARGWDDRSEV